MTAIASLWRAHLPWMFLSSAEGIHWMDDTIMCTLFTNSWVPNPDIITGYTNINEVNTTNGYIQGGVELTSKTITYTVANSYIQIWAANTIYNAGDIIRPTVPNGHLYQVPIIGRSGATQPVWSIQRSSSVVDSGITWIECGIGILCLGCADPAWVVTASINFQYVVFYDSSTIFPIIMPLIMIVDFGSTQVGPGSNILSLPLDANGLIAIPVY